MNRFHAAALCQHLISHRTRLCNTQRLGSGILATTTFKFNTIPTSLLHVLLLLLVVARARINTEALVLFLMLTFLIALMCELALALVCKRELVFLLALVFVLVRLLLL